MTAFTVTVTGPSYSATRRFPSVWCADAALKWATMLRDSYTADTADAERAAVTARRMRMEQAQQKAKERR
jgi:hypothetical protein